MKRILYLFLIHSILLLIVIQLFSCKKTIPNAYPTFQDEQLSKISQRLIYLDSLILLNEIDRFMANAGPAIDSIFVQLNLRGDTAQQYYLLAKAYRLKGAFFEYNVQLDQALSHYHAAKKIFDRHRKQNNFDALEEADLLNYLGYYHQFSNYDPALSDQYYEQSNVLNKRIGRKIEMVKNWVNMSTNAMSSRHLSRADRFLKLAEQTFKEVPDQYLYQDVSYGLANFHGILEKNFADSLSLIGEQSEAKRRCDYSIYKFKEAIRGLETINNPAFWQQKLVVSLNLTTVWERHANLFTNPADSILKYHTKALAEATPEQKPIVFKSFIHTYAFALAAKGQEQAAIDSIEIIHKTNLQQNRYAQAQFNPLAVFNVFNILIARTLIYEKLAKKNQGAEDWLKAINACRENLQHVVEVRKKLVANANQERISLENHSQTEYGLSYVFEYWKKTRAETSLDLGIELLASSKALLLEQQLQKARFFNYQNAPSLSHPAYTDFVLEKSIQESSNNNDQQGLENLRKKYLHYVDSLGKSSNILSKRYYLERFATNKPTVAKVRQLLPNTEAAIIDYQTTLNHAFALVITSKSSSLIPLPIDRKYFKAIKDYRSHLSGNSADIYPVAERLYHYLMAPLDSFLQAQKVKELILLPDHYTANIPFEGLISKSVAAKRSYLIEKYIVGYHYSLSAWLIQQQIENQKSKPQSMMGCFIAAPNIDGSFKEECAALALPALTKVSNSIAKKLGNKAHLYPLANRKTFVKNHAKYDILQLTLHGCNAQNGNPPYLVFAPGQSNQDRLHMQDIYNLTLNARLAVLASCLTADGEASTTEGAKSIARAFLFGGCPRVIAGINSVTDQAGAEILGHFYTQLFNNTPPTRALRAAKLKFLQINRDQHPSLWASLVFYGDPSWK